MRETFGLELREQVHLTGIVFLILVLTEGPPVIRAGIDSRGRVPVLIATRPAILVGHL